MRVMCYPFNMIDDQNSANQKGYAVLNWNVKFCKIHFISVMNYVQCIYLALKLQHI